jgi:hypothetical protein
MQFIFRLGPLPANGPPTFAFFVSPGRSGQEAFFARDDQDGLKQIAAVYSGEAITVEPDLADAGSKCGMQSRPVLPDDARSIGPLIFDIATPQHFDELVDHDLLHEFGLASAALWRAAPWQWNYAQHPLGITLEDSAGPTVLDAVLMGWRGPPHGIALFPHTGIVQRLGNIHDLADAVTDLSTIGLTYDPEPAFRADAMRRVYGISALPVPIRLVKGRREPFDAYSAAQMIAVMRAVAALTDAGEQSSGFVRTGTFEIQALVFPTRA